MQVEYATDLVFHKQDVLRPLYEALSRTAIHAVKCEQVATFLGHRLTESYEGEIGNDFSTRLEGTRIKHYMGPAAIKMYDKFALVLRVETTCNDVTFFKHHRRVEHRDGMWEMKLAPMKKSIYSLPDLMGLLDAANRRYLEFLGGARRPDGGGQAAGEDRGAGPRRGPQPSWVQPVRRRRLGPVPSDQPRSIHDQRVPQPRPSGMAARPIGSATGADDQTAARAWFAQEDRETLRV